MKTCPHCNAQISDEAEFCLYCMTPMKEKEWIPPIKRRPKGWLFLLGGILLLLAVFVLWPRGGDDPTDPVMQVTTTIGTTAQSTTSSPTTTASTTVSATTTPTSVSATKPTTVTTPSCSVSTTASTTAPFSATTTIPTTTKPTTTAPPTMSGSDDAGVMYYYRLSEPDDWEWDYNYQNPGNHITITGVKVQSSTGIYRIPETIDGMTVAFIGKYAFSGANGRNAKIVYVPESVLSICCWAFDNCPIEHIYFTHNIAINNYAFPDSKNILTIHCPEDARRSESGIYYSKESMKFSRATWEEWNGEDA